MTNINSENFYSSILGVALYFIIDVLFKIIRMNGFLFDYFLNEIC